MKRALALTLFRPALLLVAALVVALLFAITGGDALAVTNPQVATPYFILVGAICLVVAHRILRARGSSLRERVGYEPRRLPRDVLVGLGIAIALYVPFTVGLVGSSFLVLGPEPWNRFAEVFAAPTTSQLTWSPAAAFTIAIVTAIAFPLVNAPAEEIIYRGLAIDAFHEVRTPASPRARTALAVVVPSVVFGIQHVLLAPTTLGMVLYLGAFTLWGLGAALFAVHLQRLMPLVAAHVITNAATGVIPLVILLS